MPLTTSDKRVTMQVNGVYFAMYDKDKCVVVRADRAALSDKVRGHPTMVEQEAIFLKYREPIEKIASAKYDRGEIERDGSVRVHTQDLNPEQFAGSVTAWR